MMGTVTIWNLVLFIYSPGELVYASTLPNIVAKNADAEADGLGLGSSSATFKQFYLPLCSSVLHSANSRQ